MEHSNPELIKVTRKYSGRLQQTSFEILLLLLFFDTDFVHYVHFVFLSEEQTELKNAVNHGAKQSMAKYTKRHRLCSSESYCVTKSDFILMIYTSS